MCTPLQAVSGKEGWRDLGSHDRIMMVVEVAVTLKLGPIDRNSSKEQEEQAPAKAGTDTQQHLYTCV